MALLAVESGPNALLIALVGALAVLLPALVGYWAQSRRSKRLGPKEEDELVTRSANQAVELMTNVVEAANAERKGMVKEIARLKERVAACEHTERTLRRELAELRGQ